MARVQLFTDGGYGSTRATDLVVYPLTILHHPVFFHFLKRPVELNQILPPDLVSSLHDGALKIRPRAFVERRRDDCPPRRLLNQRPVASAEHVAVALDWRLAI